MSETIPKSKKYGFFSTQHADKDRKNNKRRCFYLTPTGESVQVTCVCDDNNAQSYLWPDKICIGEVVDGTSHSR